MTAEELLNKLAKDEKYQEMMRKKDAELKKKHEILVQESKSFSNDCRRLGYDLETPWDAIPVAEHAPELIPILMKYLEGKKPFSEISRIRGARFGRSKRITLF